MILNNIKISRISNENEKQNNYLLQNPSDNDIL